jgi:hypothetical protein
VEIEAMGIAAAFFVPRFDAPADDFHESVAFRFFQRAPNACGIDPREIVPPAFHGIYAADGTQIIDIRAFITQDASRDRRDPFRIEKFLMALLALHVPTNPLSLSLKSSLVLIYILKPSLIAEGSAISSPVKQNTRKPCTTAFSRAASHLMIGNSP